MSVVLDHPAPARIRELRDRLYMSRKSVYGKALDQWPGLLAHLGVAEEHLRLKRNGPCPFCGGRDRYSFTDKTGNGDFICRGCGAGHGIAFLMKYHRWSWAQACDEVLAALGDGEHRRLLEALGMPSAGAQRARLPVEPACRPQRREGAEEETRLRRRHFEVWEGARPVQAGDPVHRYLSGRLPGLKRIPASLRYHPRLAYYAPSEQEGEPPVLIGYFPAMVAAVTDPSGTLRNIHRTYLTEAGAKAEFVTADGEILPSKKAMPWVEARGCAIRLTEGESRTLGVAEGIETALAAQLFARVPTWSVLSTSGMRGFLVPDWVENLVIFADNDKPDSRGVRAGFEAAQALAKREDVVARLKARTLRVNVRAPSKMGTDIADLLLRQANLA